MKSAFSIELTDFQREDLITYYRGRIESARLQIDEFTQLLEKLGEANVASQPSQVSYPFYPRTQAQQSIEGLKQPSITSEYKSNWGWGKKARFILSSVGHCLTSREIVTELLKYEPALIDPPRSMSATIRNISSTISSNISAGTQFNRYKVDQEDNLNQGVYYNGLREWFDKEGNLVDEKFKGIE